MAEGARGRGAGRQARAGSDATGGRVEPVREQSATATFFATPADFRAWLAANHQREQELWVGFHRVGSGRPSITWPESVDEALCFGWIDGIRKKIDGTSYMIRFTPRRRGSVWSAVNLHKAEELLRSGRMTPAGMAAYEARDRAKPGAVAPGRMAEPVLTEAQRARFAGEAAAWSFFEAQPPGYRKMALVYVTSAKREETQDRRLETLIRECAAGRRIDLNTRVVKRAADDAQ